MSCCYTPIIEPNTLFNIHCLKVDDGVFNIQPEWFDQTFTNAVWRLVRENNLYNGIGDNSGEFNHRLYRNQVKYLKSNTAYLECRSVIIGDDLITSHLHYPTSQAFPSGQTNDKVVVSIQERNKFTGRLNRETLFLIEGKTNITISAIPFRVGSVIGFYSYSTFGTLRLVSKDLDGIESDVDTTIDVTPPPVHPAGELFVYSPVFNNSQIVVPWVRWQYNTGSDSYDPLEQGSYVVNAGEATVTENKNLVSNTDGSGHTNEWSRVGGNVFSQAFIGGFVPYEEWDHGNSVSDTVSNNGILRNGSTGRRLRPGTFFETRNYSTGTVYVDSRMWWDQLSSTTYYVPVAPRKLTLEDIPNYNDYMSVSNQPSQYYEYHVDGENSFAINQRLPWGNTPILSVTGSFNGKGAYVPIVVSDLLGGVEQVGDQLTQILFDGDRLYITTRTSKVPPFYFTLVEA